MNLSSFETQQTPDELYFESPVRDGVSIPVETSDDEYGRAGRAFFQADVDVMNYLASKGPLRGNVVDEIASTFIQRYGLVRLLDPDTIDKFPEAVQAAILRASQPPES